MKPLKQKIRFNIAFEHLVLSVLTGAAFAGLFLFTWRFLAAAISGGLSFGVLLTTILGGAAMALSVFLIGFFAGVVVVMPLFRFLEKRKRRTVSAYLVAAIVIGAVALLAASSLPGVGAPTAAVAISTLAASLLAGAEFGRRLRPLWRAARKAEAEQATNIVRLH